MDYKIRYLFFILIIGIVLLTGCQNETLTGKVTYSSEESYTYKLGGAKNINMLPIVAEKRGYYSNYNLNIERKDIQTAKMAMDSLIKGEVDFAVLVDSNLAFIEFQGDPEIEVIAIIEKKVDDSIVADMNKGITEPADLKGKRIGITAGTTSHAFAVAYLKSNGIALSDVELVNMPPASIQAAIINGNLDAGSVWQPFRYNIQRDLENTITFNDKDVYVAYAVIAVKKEFARKNPEVIENFLRALIDADEYYQENTEEVRSMLSEEVDVPKEVLDIVWDEYRLGVGLDDGLLETIEYEADWILKSESSYSKKPDYSKIVNNEFLLKIDPSRVAQGR